MAKPVLILGLGNLLQGDDGVGCRVAQLLDQGPLPPDVEVMDGGTPGLGLVNLLAGRRRVVLVDAAELGRPPGSVVRFRPEEVVLTGAADRLSVHRAGVAEALALARVLNLTPAEVVVIGVQPARVDWGCALSPPLQAALPHVAAAALREAVAAPAAGLSSPQEAHHGE